MRGATVELGACTAGAGLARAVETIRTRGLVVYPAESMYAIGGDGGDAGVAARVAALKGARAGKAFLLLLGEEEGWRAVAASFPPAATALARLHWPGPLTLLLPARSDCAVAHEGKVAVRLPDLPTVRLWARASDRPILSTSANRPDGEPIRSREEACRRLAGEADLVVLGPDFPAGGPPSTIVDATVDPPRLVRPGAIPFDTRL